MAEVVEYSCALNNYNERDVDMKGKLSVMIADDDKTYAAGLAEIINKREDMECCGCAADGEEALELAALLRPDAIVLDMLMPKRDGMGVLRGLSGCGLRKKPVVVVNSASVLTSMVGAAISCGADHFMVKPQSGDSICDTISDLAALRSGKKKHEQESTGERNEFKLEKSVTYFLHALGVPANLDGYKYMRSAIMNAAMDMSLLEPITKKLYPIIAEEYDTSVCCVERSMRHAITVSWKRGSRKLIGDVFGYTAEDGKRRPTNSEYIAMAADDFRLRYKYGKLE